MQLYMKQKVFSWKDKFSIMNSFGEDKYYVEGKVISIGKKLRIYDTAGTELAFVNQKVVSLMPKFSVEMNGEEVAVIKKKFTLLKPKYLIEGPGWEVQGDFFGHDYTITDGGKPVVAIHKKWMSWGDAFELDITDESHEVLAMAVVLAIDAVMDNQQNHAVTIGD
ncbi:MAG: LURP-one-related family protein [Eubacterium sp.]|nr:LURP-one-related family protein [Eubacterium sp.]